MMCDTCTNRMYCENEEKQMCIANDYDRYDDDGSLELDLDDTEYDQDIDTVRTVFEWIVCDSPSRGAKVLNDCCTAITSMVDKELGNLIFKNIMQTVSRCAI